MADNSRGGERRRSEGEIIAGGLFTFLFMTGIGLASNTLLLLVGFLVSVPVNVTGYTDAKTQTLWLAFAAVSELFCMVFGFVFEQNIGQNAAEYRASDGHPRSPDIPAMLGTVGLGVLLHGTLTASVAAGLMQALFFAGPVQYFARYLGHTSREVFDVASLNFPLSVKLEAVGLYLLFFTMAVITGYLAGHARRNRELEEHEAWARRLSDRPEQTWTREDADAAWHDENPAQGAPAQNVREERHTLRPETEAFFRELGKREKLLSGGLILAWFLVDVTAWYWYGTASGRGFMSPFSVAFPTLLILPFWPFRLHKRIAAKSFYAEIAKIETKTVGTGLGGGGVRARGGFASSVSPGRSSERQKLRLVLRSRLGGTEEVLLPVETEIRYFEGQQVYCAGGLTYPVPTSFDEDRLVLCPVCGHESSPGPFRCRQCFRRLGRRK